MVLVDRLDLAVARALRYARTLTPDDLRAVHFDLDGKVSSELEQDWWRLGLSRLPLDVIECPDRRLARATIELVTAATPDDKETECTDICCSLRVPRVSPRHFPRPDRRQDRGPRSSPVPNVIATIVPYAVCAGRWSSAAARYRRSLDRRALARPPGGAARGGGPTAPPLVRREPVDGLAGPSGAPGSATVSASGRRPPSAVDRALAERGAGRRHRRTSPPSRATGPGGRQGQVGPGPTPRRYVQPRVHPGRPDRGLLLVFQG